MVATLRSLEADSPGDATSRNGTTVVPVPSRRQARSPSARSKATLELPFDEGGIAWDPSLVFPGLRTGEHLESQIELAPRAPILAADGTPLAEGPAEARAHPLGSAAIDVTGEVGTAEEDRRRGARPPGIRARHPGRRQRARAGLQRPARRQARRLAARGQRRRRLRPGPSPRPSPKPGAPVKTTIDPGLQEAAVSALAGRVGGIAVLDARNGDVRALAGQAFSAPQPPGSTFKMITTTAALQKGVVSLDDEFEITDGVNVGGRFIENANGEYCGGTFREAFAESCNADFAPLGPKIGNDELVEAAERFGFNSPPTLYASQHRRRGRTGRIDDPDRDRRRTRPRRQRDRPGRGAGDAAADGERGADDRQRRRARTDLDRRQQEAAARGRAGAGDVEEDRRRTDRTDDRRRHRRHRHRRRDPRGPGGRQDRHRRARPEARRRGRRTPRAAQGRLVRRLRPGRKAKAGGRRAADRSRSGGRRGRGPGGGRRCSRPGSRRRPTGRA